MNIDHHGENCLVLRCDISFFAPLTVQKNYKMTPAAVVIYSVYVINICRHTNMISEVLARLGNQFKDQRAPNDVPVVFRNC